MGVIQVPSGLKSGLPDSSHRSPNIRHPAFFHVTTRRSWAHVDQDGEVGSGHESLSELKLPCDTAYVLTQAYSRSFFRFHLDDGVGAETDEDAKSSPAE